MNELDRKTQVEAALMGPLTEQSLWEQVMACFRGRMRWLAVMVTVSIPALGIFAVVCAVYFFHAESVREMLAWAGGFGFGLIAVTASRLWFWSLMHHYAVLREVKRLELGVGNPCSRTVRRTGRGAGGVAE